MDYEITKDEATAVVRRVVFFLPSSADGYTPVTGKVDGDFTCRVSKNGADALHVGTFVEINAGNQPGMYYYEATAGEVDTEGWLLLVISCAGCVAQRIAVRIGASNTDISAKATDIGTMTTDIDAKTTNLPADPADQSAVESAITTAEGNIRGGSDTLDSLSDQLDTAQADLDNPDQYKAGVSALALEANVRGHADDALAAYDPPTRTEATTDKDEVIAEVDANEVKIDALQTDVTALPAAVLEESIVDHKAVADSLAAVLQLLKRRAVGKVVRDDNWITIYDDDQTTILAKIPVTETEYGPPEDE